MKELLDSIRTIGMADVKDYQSDIETDVERIQNAETMPDTIVYMTRKQGTWLFGIDCNCKDEMARLKMIADFYQRQNIKFKLYLVNTENGNAKKVKIEKAIEELSKALTKLEHSKRKVA